MWKLVFNVFNVILKILNFKKKTHKIHMNNGPCKAFKKYAFGTIFFKKNKKLQLIWTYENMIKF
jgi:hypothetical protein